MFLAQLQKRFGIANVPALSVACRAAFALPSLPRAVSHQWQCRPAVQTCLCSMMLYGINFWLKQASNRFAKGRWHYSSSTATNGQMTSSKQVNYNQRTQSCAMGPEAGQGSLTVQQWAAFLSHAHGWREPRKAKDSLVLVHGQLRAGRMQASHESSGCMSGEQEDEANIAGVC